MGEVSLGDTLPNSAIIKTLKRSSLNYFGAQGLARRGGRGINLKAEAPAASDCVPGTSVSVAANYKHMLVNGLRGTRVMREQRLRARGRVNGCAIHTSTHKVLK